MDEPITVKWCGTCARKGQPALHPVTEFGICRSNPDGLSKRCKPCDREAKNAWKHRNPDWWRTHQNQERVAARRQKWYDEKHPDYYAANREMLLAKTERWRAANAERIREYSHRYAQEHKEEIIAYYREHIDERQSYGRKYYEENREKMLAASRAWARANPDKANTSAHRRRARVKGLPGSHTTAEWLALLDAYDHRCATCGRHESKCKTLHRDHIIPVTLPELGATNNIDNIQPLCGSCNKRKSNSTKGLEKMLEERAIKTLMIEEDITPDYLSSWGTPPHDVNPGSVNPSR